MIQARDHGIFQSYVLKGKQYQEREVSSNNITVNQLCVGNMYQAKRVGGQHQNREGQEPLRPSQLTEKTNQLGTGEQAKEYHKERSEQGTGPAG